MSGWEGGSTRAWRKVRAEVLERDRWRCRLCGHPISRRLRFPHPKSASVHHLKGKAHGDDPAHLVAAHLDCNRAAGAPIAKVPADRDPAPAPRTSW